MSLKTARVLACDGCGAEMEAHGREEEYTLAAIEAGWRLLLAVSRDGALGRYGGSKKRRHVFACPACNPRDVVERAQQALRDGEQP